MARAVGGPLPAPAHVYQLDGSAWAPYACMGAAAAMALDAYTRGTIRPGQAAIRANQDDQAGGIGVDDVAVAWRRGWGLTFVAGSPAWPTISDRLRGGLGVVVSINYRVMGRWRAPGSTFAGAHALYLQRLVRTSDGTAWLVVNDPLRRADARIPESIVRLAYTGTAGWGRGVYQGGATGGAQLGAWGNLISFPVGHVLTTADVDAMMAALARGGFFEGAFGGPFEAESSAAKMVRAILTRHVGERWDKALQERIAA